MLSRRFGAPLLRARVVRPPLVSANLNVNSTRTMAGHAHLKEKLPEKDGNDRFREFSLAGKVFAVTGGARGLGLSLAEALVEAGGEGKSRLTIMKWCLC